MQAAIVGLLDPPVYNYVRKLQTEIYKLSGGKKPLGLEPHFTIKYAFEAGGLAKVESYFDNLVEQTPKLEMEIDKIDSFENENRVVFVNIKKTPTITELHLKILGEVKEKFGVEAGEFEGKEFHFHITIAYNDIDQTAFEKIKDDLKDEVPNLKMRIERLGLYVQPDPKVDWFIYKMGRLS